MTSTAKPTLKDAFIGKIAGQILNGKLKPGDRLPAERQLADEEGISRSAVHLALSELERMGFIETTARHGTYVCDFTKKGNIETLNLLIRLNGADFSPERIRDLLDMRMAIEGKALELLCPRITAGDLAVLRADTRKAEQTAQSEEDNRSLSADFFAFHHDICVLSGNFILPLLFNTFEYATLAYWEAAIEQLGRKKCVEILEGFLRAVETKDARRCQSYLHQECEIFMTKIERSSSSSESRQHSEH